MADAPTPNSSSFGIFRQPTGALKRLMEILTLRGQPWSVPRFQTAEELKKVPPAPYTNAELETVLADLPEVDRGEALAKAALHGDLSIAKRLIELYGPIPTTLEGDKYDTRLNGYRFYTHEVKPFLRNAATSGEIAELLEWMPSVGLGWMVGVDSERSEMLNYGGLETACRFVRATWFDGELPTFANGKIENPELLLALHEQKSHSAYPDVYDKILCWVPESTVSQFPDAFLPFASRQQVQVEDTLKGNRQDQTRWIPLSECSKELFDSLENEWAAKTDPARQYKALRYSDLELKTGRAQDTIDPLGDMLLGHLTNESVRHGFWEHPGMVLCQSTVSFLSQFEMGGCLPGNQQRTQAFMASYAPVDLIALDNTDPSKLSAQLFNNKVGYKRGREGHQYAVNDLFTRFNAPEPLRSQVKDALPKELMVFLTEFFGNGDLNAKSLSTLYREYGIDNAGSSLRLSGEDIETLHQQGFRFNERSKVLFSHDNSGVGLATEPGEVTLSSVGTYNWTDDRLQAYHSKVQEMGLWSGEIKQPASVAEALSALCRRKFNTGLVKGKFSNQSNAPIFAIRAYMLEAGPKACAEVAKTKSHWLALSDLFGTDVLHPYMQATSLSTIGALFSKDLGL